MPESRSRKRSGQSRRPPAVQTPPRHRKTAKWVLPAMFTFLGAGALVIVLNYMGIFGVTRNWLLFAGLGLMGAGFVVATRLY